MGRTAERTQGVRHLCSRRIRRSPGSCGGDDESSDVTDSSGSSFSSHPTDSFLLASHTSFHPLCSPSRGRVVQQTSSQAQLSEESSAAIDTELENLRSRMRAYGEKIKVSPDRQPPPCDSKLSSVPSSPLCFFFSLLSFSSSRKDLEDEDGTEEFEVDEEELRAATEELREHLKLAIQGEGPFLLSFPPPHRRAQWFISSVSLSPHDAVQGTQRSSRSFSRHSTPKSQSLSNRRDRR